MLMHEFCFIKNLEKRLGSDKVAWPTKVKEIFAVYEEKRYERENKDMLEKERKRLSRKVRPHELISGAVLMGIKGKKNYRDNSEDIASRYDPLYAFKKERERAIAPRSASAEPDLRIEENTI